MTSCFQIIERMDQNQRRRVCFVQFARWRHRGTTSAVSRLYLVTCIATGDCWLLAAVSCLSQYPNLMWKIIPAGQGFTAAEGYCGIFRFNFWAFGKWKEIVIDDLLPTFNGRLVFMHSPEKNEFWTALLEKAYAKYESDLMRYVALRCAYLNNCIHSDR